MIHGGGIYRCDSQHHIWKNAMVVEYVTFHYNVTASKITLCIISARWYVADFSINFDMMCLCWFISLKCHTLHPISNFLISMQWIISAKLTVSNHIGSLICSGFLEQLRYSACWVSITLQINDALWFIAVISDDVIHNIRLKKLYGGIRCCISLQSLIVVNCTLCNSGSLVCIRLFGYFRYVVFVLVIFITVSQLLPPY